MNKNELISGKEYLVKLEAWYVAEYTQGMMLLADCSDHLPELCEQIIPLDLALQAGEIQDKIDRLQNKNNHLLVVLDDVLDYFSADWYRDGSETDKLIKRIKKASSEKLKGDQK